MRRAQVPAMLRRALAVLIPFYLAPALAWGQTGVALPGLEPFDDAMFFIIKKWNVPGASLAVADKSGRLVLARGYGFANKDKKEPVQPTSLFRYASLTKVVTAATVLRLVDEGLLKLDDKALPLIGDLGPRPGKPVDPRINDITVRQLLNHTAGFNRTRSGDPMGMPRAAQAAERQGSKELASCPMLLRDTLEYKLDFAPGEYYAYSNIGYCWLGRIIEKVTGQPFLDVVRSRILEPAGAKSIQLGKTLEAAPGEVTYYDYPQAQQGRAWPGFPFGFAPRPYGSLAIEMRDANGGLIGSAADYLRFFLAVDGKRGKALLSRKMVEEMRAPPALPGGEGRQNWYGLGLFVHKNGNIWHTGEQPVVEAWAIRTTDGTSWVVVVNTRQQDSGRDSPADRFYAELNKSLHDARRKVTSWPTGDLFDKF